MAHFTYFAYGSNMLAERLQAETRCPTARVIGPAFAPDFELCFAKRSTRDGSGKASLSPRAGGTAYGVLFAIDEYESGRLNRAEGAGVGYQRLEGFPVFDLQHEKSHAAATFLAAPEYFDQNLEPFDWYHALVLAGAKQNGLPAEHLRTILNVQTVSDPEQNRLTRIEALNVLRKSGYHP